MWLCALDAISWNNNFHLVVSNWIWNTSVTICLKRRRLRLKSIKKERAKATYVERNIIFTDMRMAHHSNIDRIFTSRICWFLFWSIVFHLLIEHRMHMCRITNLHVLHRSLQKIIIDRIVRKIIKETININIVPIAHITNCLITLKWILALCRCVNCFISQSLS